MRLQVVGIGPGDPGLITLKAAEALRLAPVVFAPRSAGEGNGLAQRIAESLIGASTVIQLDFPMTRDRDVLDRAWKESALEIAAKLASAGNGAFITLGDPALYSTFSYLKEALRRFCPEVTVEVIPGVSAVSAAAAAAGMSLVEGSEGLAVVPGSSLPHVRRALDGFETVVIVKAAKNLAAITKLIEEYGLLDHSTLFSRVGLPDAQSTPLAAAGVDRAYLSTIVVRRQPS